MEQDVDLRIQIVGWHQAAALRHTGAKGVFADDQVQHGRYDSVYGVLQIQRTELAAFDPALQNAPYQGIARFDHFVLVKKRQLWKVTGFADHQLGNARDLGIANLRPPLPHRKAQHFG